MISLSNRSKKVVDRTKVIKIKQLPKDQTSNYIKQEKRSTETIKTDYERLKSEYSFLKREIDELEKEKIQKIIETKETIDAEKRQWENEKKHLIEQAEKEGYEQGFNHGKAKALEQFSKRLDEANAMIKLATRDYHETVRQSDITVIELATYIAEKIIHKQIEIDDEIILRIVKQSIKRVSDGGEVHLYVAPQDYEQLLHHKSELQNLLKDGAKLSLFIEENEEQGYCKIDYRSGQTDVSIATQINQIEKELLRLLAENEQ